MTAEDIIKDALDGTFRKVLADGGYADVTVKKDFVPSHKSVFDAPKRFGVVTRTYREWSDDETQRLMELRGAGMPVSDIARLMKRGECMLRKKWAALAEKGLVKPLPVKAAHWRRWPKETLVAIDEMRRDGIPRRDMAVKLGLDFYQLRNYLQALNEMARVKRIAA